MHVRRCGFGGIHPAFRRLGLVAQDVEHVAERIETRCFDLNFACCGCLVDATLLAPSRFRCSWFSASRRHRVPRFLSFSTLEIRCHAPLHLCSVRRWPHPASDPCESGKLPRRSSWETMGRNWFPPRAKFLIYINSGTPPLGTIADFAYRFRSLFSLNNSFRIFSLVDLFPKVGNLRSVFGP